MNKLPGRGHEAQSRSFEYTLLTIRQKLVSKAESLSRRFETEEFEDAVATRDLASLFKAIQSADDLIKRIRQEREQQLDQRADTMENRRELERRIAALVEQSLEDPLCPDDSGSGG